MNTKNILQNILNNEIVKKNFDTHNIQELYEQQIPLEELEILADYFYKNKKILKKIIAYSVENKIINEKDQKNILSENYMIDFDNNKDAIRQYKRFGNVELLKRFKNYYNILNFLKLDCLKIDVLYINNTLNINNGSNKINFIWYDSNSSKYSKIYNYKKIFGIEKIQRINEKFINSLNEVINISNLDKIPEQNEQYISDFNTHNKEKLELFGDS